MFNFVRTTVFDPADLVIRSDGVCRLNPEMAQIVVAWVSRRGRNEMISKAVHVIGSVTVITDNAASLEYGFVWRNHGPTRCEGRCVICS